MNKTPRNLEILLLAILQPMIIGPQGSLRNKIYRKLWVFKEKVRIILKRDKCYGNLSLPYEDKSEYLSFCKNLPIKRLYFTIGCANCFTGLRIFHENHPVVVTCPTCKQTHYYVNRGKIFLLTQTQNDSLSLG